MNKVVEFLQKSTKPAYTQKNVHECKNPLCELSCTED